MMFCTSSSSPAMSASASHWALMLRAALSLASGSVLATVGEAGGEAKKPPRQAAGPGAPWSRDEVWSAACADAIAPGPAFAPSGWTAKATAKPIEANVDTFQYTGLMQAASSRNAPRTSSDSARVKYDSGLRSLGRDNERSPRFLTGATGVTLGLYA